MKPQIKSNTRGFETTYSVDGSDKRVTLRFRVLTSNSGAAFARNHSPATIFVCLVVWSVDSLEETREERIVENHSARSVNEGAKVARAYIREHGLRQRAKNLLLDIDKERWNG